MSTGDSNENPELDFLANREPEEWPSAWRDAGREADHPMPAHLDASVLGAMRAALEEDRVVLYAD